ncbi:MAG: LysM peptidoglycan-binding domain-containing protein, partial [Sulfuricella sp.]|nr:LysM peptidoglycan-binding domain-containing protein [Sulfuricella sp.]
MRIPTCLPLLFFLPACSALAASAGDDWQYPVQPGDTLIGVSRAYLAKRNDWRKIGKLNRVADPKRLMPGKPLRLPIALLRQDGAPAEVIRVQGETLIRAGGAWQPLAAGARLPAG